MITAELTKRVPFRALSQATVKQLITKAKPALKIPEGFTLSVAIVSDQEIAKVNKKYRGKPAATDVLSFRYDDLSGEIIIAADRVREQAKQFGNTLSQEAAFMVVHGLVHIMGWDHTRSKKEEEQQQQLERKILQQCQINYAR
ncbi:rRNA maturation RNase YbeY [Patescibacteria group bacterium]